MMRIQNRSFQTITAVCFVFLGMILGCKSGPGKDAYIGQEDKFSVEFPDGPGGVEVKKSSFDTSYQKAKSDEYFLTVEARPIRTNTDGKSDEEIIDSVFPLKASPPSTLGKNLYINSNAEKVSVNWTTGYQKMTMASNSESTTYFLKCAFYSKPEKKVYILTAMSDSEAKIKSSKVEKFMKSFRLE